MRLATARTLPRMLSTYRGADLSYEPVGATCGDLPDGYTHLRRRVCVGSGTEVLDRASQGLRTWEMHRRSGLKVAADGPADTGSTVVAGLGVGIMLVIPCRVIYVVDEPTRRGFAYGTLPDHPEQGEEAFIVTQDADGSVWFEITAFSRAGAALVRLAGPAGHVIQSRATSRYERAMASIATA